VKIINFLNYCVHEAVYVFLLGITCIYINTCNNPNVCKTYNIRNIYNIYYMHNEIYEFPFTM
jgi:hypothetical protein